MTNRANLVATLPLAVPAMADLTVSAPQARSTARLAKSRARP